MKKDSNLYYQSVQFQVQLLPQLPKIFSVLSFRQCIAYVNSSQLCKCCIAVGNTEMKISFFPIRHYCGLQLQELSSISEPIKSHSVTLLGPFLDTFFTLRRSGSSQVGIILQVETTSLFCRQQILRLNLGFIQIIKKYLEDFVHNQSRFRPPRFFFFRMWTKKEQATVHYVQTYVVITIMLPHTLLIFNGPLTFGCQKRRHFFSS